MHRYSGVKIFLTVGPPAATAQRRPGFGAATCSYAPTFLLWHPVDRRRTVGTLTPTF